MLEPLPAAVTMRFTTDGYEGSVFGANDQTVICGRSVTMVQPRTVEKDASFMSFSDASASATVLQPTSELLDSGSDPGGKSSAISGATQWSRCLISGS